MNTYFTAKYHLLKDYDEFDSGEYVQVLAGSAEEALAKRMNIRCRFQFTRKNQNAALSVERDNAHVQFDCDGHNGCAAWRKNSVGYFALRGIRVMFSPERLNS